MFSEIKDILQDFQQGKIVIIMDDEDRENEGDLCVGADFATPEAINFMARFGRGLICMPISFHFAKKLGLKQMVENNTSKYNTQFTVSIGAKHGITTGISAFDRSKTVLDAINGKEITSPGHIFPLVANEGGILARNGHTEASVELSKLCGLKPAAVICEIMKDDGTMARRDDIAAFAKEHNLKVSTIQKLVEYIKNKN